MVWGAGARETEPQSVTEGGHTLPFGKKEPAPEVSLTVPQLCDKYRAEAAELFGRSHKAGRLEAETRLATMATAAAVLATSYQLQLLYGQLVELNKKLPAVAQ